MATVWMQTYLGTGGLQTDTKVLALKGRGSVKHCVEAAAVATLGSHLGRRSGQILHEVQEGLAMDLARLLRQRVCMLGNLIDSCHGSRASTRMNGVAQRPSCNPMQKKDRCGFLGVGPTMQRGTKMDIA